MQEVAEMRGRNLEPCSGVLLRAFSFDDLPQLRHRVYVNLHVALVYYAHSRMSTFMPRPDVR